MEILDKQARMEWLSGLIRDPQASQANQLKALEILNRMDGAYETQGLGDTVIRVTLEE